MQTAVASTRLAAPTESSSSAVNWGPAIAAATGGRQRDEDKDLVAIIR